REKRDGGVMCARARRFQRVGSEEHRVSGGTGGEGHTSRVGAVTIALDGLGQGQDQVSPRGLEMRMHLEGAAEQAGRLAILAEGEVAESLAGQGAEVARVAGEGLAAVGDGPVVAPGEKAD